MADSFAGGLASGLSPILQAQMYAQALRNSGLTNPQTGAPYNADQSGSGIGNWISQKLGFTRSPYTQANPYVPSVDNGGIAPATPGAPGGNYLQGFRAVMPPAAPAGTGTTQGHPAVRRPLPIPPIPPGQAAGSGAYAWPPFTNAAPQQLSPDVPPYGVDASDVGSGALIYQPLTTGYGAFGNITSAPSRAANFQNQFGFGQPGTNQRYRKWFTERYGTPPSQTAGR